MAKLISIINLEDSSDKHSEIYLLDSGRFEVVNMEESSTSRGFPNKTYIIKASAVKYANEFLNFEA